jgi:hypothetical protein
MLWTLLQEEERMRPVLLQHHGPVPSRQQRHHVCHSTRCSLNLRTTASNCYSAAPARLPLRPRLEACDVLQL